MPRIKGVSGEREAETSMSLPSSAEFAPAPDPVAALRAWFDTHIRNSRFSRDTATHNRIHAAVAEIETAMANLKE
jgi:hypothetical protein